MPFVEAREADGARGLAFVVPPELEAHEPPEYRSAARDDIRLLVTDAVHGVRHSRFGRLPDFLAPGDLLVLNDSKTYPAALRATRESGEPVWLHFASLGPGEWSNERASNAGVSTETAWRGLVLAEPRKASLSHGERATLPGGGRATFLGLHRSSRRMWVAKLDLPLPYFAYFGRYGKPIAYPHVIIDLPIETYQTAYARAIGSSEMPSAGRPFTRRMLDRLTSRGVEITTITLHAGVSSAERDELPIEEWRDVPPESAAAVRRAIKRGSKVVAVGTTVVRALESSLDARHRVIPAHGWTGLHITPDRPMRAVTGLLTGFHEPTSTHLAILESIAGKTRILNAYRAALFERYLWHEFGDSHLILPFRG